MSYAMASALQQALYQHLLDDALLHEELAGAIYDAVPAGALPDTYVAIGPEDVRDRSDGTGSGADHRFTLSVISRTAGFATAKRVAGLICDRLTDAELSLNRGRLVGLWFDRASARRSGTADEDRRIDLRFRARIEDN